MALYIGMSVATLDSATAAKQSLQASKEGTNTDDKSYCQVALDKENRKVVYLKEIATEVIHGVKAVLPTSSCFCQGNTA